ncbi:MazG nucleotide pyrophosphohydrolase domain-containing protein [Corynebacterium sp. H128]|uniref:MazG nucleotide pyrophosphohydrolase domain-containing protein n=1 Tax=unclassified Corynebacterium TaxID=2624378 RepID=UPI0030A056D1
MREIEAKFPADDNGATTPIRVGSLSEAQWVMARALQVGEWERSMTHGELLAYLDEEVGEFREAVTDWEREPSVIAETKLMQELSDVLLQVLFHAELARRRGVFDLEDVAAAFVDKMRSRAPYLFSGGDRVVARAEQERLWAEGKRREAR